MRPHIVRRQIQSQPPAGDTALAQAAALLGPGQSLRFGTIPAAVLDIDDAGFSILQYMSAFAYDPHNKQVRGLGKRSGPNAPYRFMIYREATDAWSIAGNTVWSGGQSNQSGHGYDHNTTDPDASIHYFKPYDSPTVQYWTPDTGAWASLAAMGSPNPVITGFLEWIPGTGLVYGDRRTLRSHPGASSPGTAWTIHENLGSDANAYHAAGAWNRNSQVLLWGWGNLDNNSRKCAANLTGITLTSSVGLDLGAAEGGGLIAPDPTGLGFIGWKKESLTWRHYLPSSDAWTPLTKSTGSGSNPQNGTPNFVSDPTGRHSMCCSIDPYGVIMFVQYNGGGAGAAVWLYRHT